jgi:hypothetical protein
MISRNLHLSASRGRNPWPEAHNQTENEKIGREPRPPGAGSVGDSGPRLSNDMESLAQEPSDMN